MAAWDKDPIVQPKAAAGGKPWEKDPIAKPGGDNLTALREALRTAHDTGNTAEERRLSGLLKQIDVNPIAMGETTVKPVSADSMYQPGFKPLDQAGAAVSQAINQIPVAGSWLEKQAASGQAWLHNTMKPNDLPISQGDVLNTNMQREAANPEGATVGKVAGNVAPYVAASKFALPAKVLGLEGSLASRIGFTGGSQLAINTGDRMVREGEGLPEAAMNSILPTLLAMPLAAFGSPTRAGQVVTSELKRAGISAADVQAELDRLGPGAVIGDLSPQLQARLGALATSPGPAQDMAVAAMSERAAGANSRIKGSVQNTFGPEPVPSQVAAEIDVARKTANQAYEPVFREKALSPDYLYDAAPLAQAIDEAIPTFVGNTRSQVEAVRKMLLDPATGKLTTDPQVIRAVRGELDGMIEALKAPGGNRTTFAALSDLRKMIDADLGQQVPGIKMADAGRAEVGAQERGFELGREALRNGESAIHPVDLKASLDDLSGPQGTAIGPQVTNAPQRVSEGALSRIYQAIGVTANDRVALKQLLKGDGSWNREKMNAIFGREKTAKLIDLLDNEAIMAQTENLVLGNSKTSVLQSAKEALGPATGNGPVRSALNMKWGDAVAALMDKATLGAAGAERQKANKALVEVLLSNKALSGARSRLLDPRKLAVITALVAAGNTGQ
jgi:hypothetical protein